MKQNLRAYIYIDLRKFLLYNVVESIFWFLLCLYYLILLGRYNIEVAHTVAFVPSSFFLIKNWKIYRKKKYLKIYDNGIDFYKLGFWKWDNIKYKRRWLKHQFELEYTDIEITKDQLKQAKHKYTDKNGHNIMIVIYQNPPFSGNLSNSEIANLIKKLQP